MKEQRVYALLLAFFAGSWLTNGHIISTTTTLLRSASLSLILAASSLAGLGFFFIVRLLGHSQRPTHAGPMMVPVWGCLLVAPQVVPGHPIVAALVALLFGELAKWHLYSQVLNTWGPMGAQGVLARTVIAYELGTVASSFWSALPLWVQALLLAAIYAPAYFKSDRPAQAPHLTVVKEERWSGMLSWIIACGALAGLLRVSADTGLKFAIRLDGDGAQRLLSHYYLISALFTLGLSVARRLRITSLGQGPATASFIAVGASQSLFAFALMSGHTMFLIAACALQRSVDKVFYQPTVQLLSSGFTALMQERLRRWHVVGFLALGPLCGLVAFSGHALLGSVSQLLWAIALVHAAVAVSFFWVGGRTVETTVAALEVETQRFGVLGSPRPLAMLALLAPRHFLARALTWASRQSGGVGALPAELMQGLTVESGDGVVRAFYAAYPKLDETQQLALIRLAALLDLRRDREFLMTVALEQVGPGRRTRRLAAHHLVKVLGKEARPLLRRSRGKNSPLPGTKKAA